jgi:hypothetical protein
MNKCLALPSVRKPVVHASLAVIHNHHMHACTVSVHPGVITGHAGGALTADIFEKWWVTHTLPAHCTALHVCLLSCTMFCCTDTGLPTASHSP